VDNLRLPIQDYPQGLFRASSRFNNNGGHYLWLGNAWQWGCSTDLDSKEMKWLTINDSTVPALPNNIIYEIRKDVKDRIYIFTNKGNCSSHGWNSKDRESDRFQYIHLYN
jgi:hypothetical protein